MGETLARPGGRYASTSLVFRTSSVWPSLPSLPSCRFSDLDQTMDVMRRERERERERERQREREREREREKERKKLKRERERERKKEREKEGGERDEGGSVRANLGKASLFKAPSMQVKSFSSDSDCLQKCSSRLRV